MILRSQGTTELAILESELLIHNRLCLSHSVRLEESEADPFPRGPIVEYEHQVSSRTEYNSYVGMRINSSNSFFDLFVSTNLLPLTSSIELPSWTR